MKTMLLIAAVSLPLLSGTLSAQDTKPSPAKSAAAKVKSPAKAEKAALRKVTDGEIGKEAVCPVTGEKLTVAKETGSASYKGQVYYFCCPGCDKSFLANPEKYAAKGKAAKPQEKKAVYACPMGDYQGDKPGKCPKCGMTLVEKK